MLHGPLNPRFCSLRLNQLQMVSSCMYFLETSEYKVTCAAQTCIAQDVTVLVQGYSWLGSTWQHGSSALWTHTHQDRRKREGMFTGFHVPIQKFTRILLPVSMTRATQPCAGIRERGHLPPSSPLCSQYPSLRSVQMSIRVFSNEPVLRIRWPKYWSFSFNISPSNEHPGLISFRMDWLDLLAVQGTLKSLFQHHSSKAPILRRSAFFLVHLPHPHVTPGVQDHLRKQVLEEGGLCADRRGLGALAPEVQSWRYPRNSSKEGGLGGRQGGKSPHEATFSTKEIPPADAQATSPASMGSQKPYLGAQRCILRLPSCYSTNTFGGGDGG